MIPRFYLAWYEKRGLLSLVESIDYENDIATISFVDERTDEEKYIEVAIDDLEWFEEARTRDINGGPLFDGTIVASDVLPHNGGVIISGEIPFTNEDGKESHYEGFALLTSSDMDKDNNLILPLSAQLVEKYNLESIAHVKITETWEE